MLQKGRWSLLVSYFLPQTAPGGGVQGPAGPASPGTPDPSPDRLAQDLCSASVSGDMHEH